MLDETQPLSEQLEYTQVAEVIHAFYGKLMQHPKLGTFFKDIEDFPVHEKRIVDFWWMSMGGKLEQPPKIDMIGKHFALGIQAEDLETWLVLFGETLGEHLEQSLAARWMDKALQIGARLKQIAIDHQPMGVNLK